MTAKEAQEKIGQLSKELKEHNYRYYVLAEPIISDYEFDMTLKKLEELEKQFPQFLLPNSPTQRVGGAVTKNFETVTHRVPMLSLSNTYSKEELLEFDQRIKRFLPNTNFEYTTELKFDGFAISLIYENGILSKAITRGDGVQGDDVTNNIKTVRSIPPIVKGSNVPELFEIRGEVFMHRKAFERMNEERLANGEKPFANPRNSAAGSIKMQEQNEVAKRPLDCFLYHVIFENEIESSHYNSLQWAKQMGFNVNDALQKHNSIEEVWAYIEKWNLKRRLLSFDIDGVVIKVNSNDHQQQLGNTSKSPRWAIAYKFETEAAKTKLISVDYQVGRTGNITPVANLEPVHLLGTTVKRASLHNADFIKEFDLHINDDVLIEKGGEIIPKIVEVDVSLRKNGAEKVEFIENCPVCESKLERNEGEAAFYCPNTWNCAPQIKGRIEHFISRKALDINSLGEGKIEMLFQAGLLNNPADLYQLKFEQLNGLSKTIINEETGEERLISFREKTALNILDGIEKSKNVPFHRVLYGLGIRYVGATTAKKIVANFKNIDKLKLASKEELLAIDDVGESIAQSIKDFFIQERNQKLIEDLKNAGICFEDKTEININNETPISEKKIVVSGKFTNFSRDGIKEYLEKNGAILMSSISSKTDLIVAGEDMGPSKKQKAVDLGINLISEQELIELLAKNKE